MTRDDPRRPATIRDEKRAAAAQRQAHVRALRDRGVKLVRDRDSNVWELKRTLWHHVAGPHLRTGWRGRMPSLYDLDRRHGPVTELPERVAP